MGDVELVALRIGANRPVEPLDLVVVNSHPAELDDPGGDLLPIVRRQVDMHPVLDRLRFGYELEGEIDPSVNTALMNTKLG